VLYECRYTAVLTAEDKKTNNAHNVDFTSAIQYNKLHPEDKNCTPGCV